MTARLGLLLPLSRDAFDPAEPARVGQVVHQRLVTGVWVRDLPVVPTGDPDAGQGADPFAHLAHLAGQGVAPEVFGTASVILGLRHPLVVARAVVGLQHVTGNRVVLGVGTGGKPAMNDALGLDRRGRADFVDDWRTLRRAVCGPAVDLPAGVELSRPPGYRPPPMQLATTDLAKWEAIDGDAEGWQTFLTDPDSYCDQYRRVCDIRAASTDTAVRLDAHVVASADAPHRLVAERGRVRCSIDQLVELVATWRELPVTDLLMGVRADEPLAVLRALACVSPRV